MNPMAIVKGAKVFAIVGALSFALYIVNDWRLDQAAQRDALITANATAVSAEARAQAIATANAQLEAVAESQAVALAQAAEAMRESAEQFEEIQRTQLEQKAVLEDLSQLERAVDGRHTLVVRLANRATRERFDEVEAIFDGT